MSKPKHKRKRKMHNKKSLLSQKRRVVSDAYDAYAKAADEFGSLAIDAYHIFAQRVYGNPPEGKTTLTVEEARNELNNSISFTRSLIEVDRDDFNRAKEDAFIEIKLELKDIKKQTTARTAVGVGLLVCLASPYIVTAEQKVIGWVKPVVIEQYNNARDLCKRAIKYAMAPPPPAPKVPNKKNLIATPQKKKATP